MAKEKGRSAARGQRIASREGDAGGGGVPEQSGHPPAPHLIAARQSMPEAVSGARSVVRSAVEHVFADRKQRMALFIRTIGLGRATVKIGFANLAYNFRRLIWLKGRTPTTLSQNCCISPNF